jgi:hypothetical protein
MLRICTRKLLIDINLANNHIFLDTTKVLSMKLLLHPLFNSAVCGCDHSVLPCHHFNGGVCGCVLPRVSCVDENVP